MGTATTTPLPRNPGCAAAARRIVERDLSDHVPQEALDDARTIATELVTNAYVHGQGAIDFRLSSKGDRVRIEVIDEGHGAAVAIREEAIVGGGQGLRIVQLLASDWGAFQGTTHVWAELALTPEAEPS